MKKKRNLKKVDADRTVIICKCGEEGFELRAWDRIIGDSPLGPRLSRSTDFPSLPTKSPTWASALDLQNRWQAWLEANERKA